MERIARPPEARLIEARSGLRARLGAIPLLGAAVAQVLGSLLAVVLFFVMPEVLRIPLLAAAIQGAAAAIVAHRLGAPTWWQGIHLVFAPLLVGALALRLPPGIWLAGFGILLAIFWRTDRSRVPLYLSNMATADALATLLPPGPCFVLDLGCGDGGLLRRLAQLRPDANFVGIEHAPLTWLWARLRASGRDNVDIRHGDFWTTPLTPYDVVYAFLSPAPMPRLWEAARAQMRPGTLLVSNSFEVPGETPERTVAVADRRATQLLCYRPAG